VLALPLIIVFLWRVARRPAVVAAASGAVAIFAVLAYRDWAARWACPGDPDYASILVWANFGSALELHVVGDFVRNQLHALAGSGRLVIPTNSFRSPTMSREFCRRSTGRSSPARSASASRSSWPGRQSPMSWDAVASLAERALRRRRHRRAGGCFISPRWRPASSRANYEAELMEPVMAMAALGSYWLAWPLVTARLWRSGAVGGRRARRVDRAPRPSWRARARSS